MFVPIAILVCNALASSRFDPNFSLSSSSTWRPLPHVDRREAITGGAGFVSAASFISGKSVHAISTTNERSVASIESNVIIPVWPSWGGGRVVPVSLGGPQQDPFLLLAHHKHWFDPRDPLRKPFQVSIAMFL
jgi:hypothetical protein